MSVIALEDLLHQRFMKEKAKFPMTQQVYWPLFFGWSSPFRDRLAYEGYWVTDHGHYVMIRWDEYIVN